MLIFAHTMEKDAFRTMLAEAIGISAADALLHTLASSEPSVSIRVNASKGARIPDGVRLVPWDDNAFYLSERPLFAADPAWHQGMYYVQDASSMAVAVIARYIANTYFDEVEALYYLDACAAPGGKTIAAIDALGPGAFVVANEADSRRASVLAENLCKHGSIDTAVLHGQAQRLGSLREAFHIISVDAPCSGEGMMRKEPEAVAQWTPALVESCAHMQRDIVSSLWPALKPGGVMLYSTCTFNRHENDEVVEYMCRKLGAERIAIDSSAFPGAIAGENGLRFLPGLVDGEGLFVAALRKPGIIPSEEINKTRLPKAHPDIERFAHRAIADMDDKTIFGENIVRKCHTPLISRLMQVKGIMSIGLQPGVLKGRDIAPTHALAMSTALRSDFLPTTELHYHRALAYLRGESLTDIDSDIPTGFIAPSWNGRPLGIAKNIGRRANNLYPDAWRLRLQPHNLPQQPPEIL